MKLLRFRESTTAICCAGTKQRTFHGQHNCRERSIESWMRLGGVLGPRRQVLRNTCIGRTKLQTNRKQSSDSFIVAWSTASWSVFRCGREKSCCATEPSNFPSFCPTVVAVAVGSRSRTCATIIPWRQLHAISKAIITRKQVRKQVHRAVLLPS